MGYAKVDNFLKADKFLDVQGLFCPKPIVMTAGTLQSMDKGQILQVVCSDNTAKLSIPMLCERGSFKLLDLTEGDGVLNFFIRK